MPLLYCHLAFAYQRALSQDVPEHRIDAVMRRRAWEWWSLAQQQGIVLQ
jgi:hypothetical protein